MPYSAQLRRQGQPAHSNLVAQGPVQASSMMIPARGTLHLPCVRIMCAVCAHYVRIMRERRTVDVFHLSLLLMHVRVRFHIIRNARMEHVAKYHSCMISNLRIILKQTVRMAVVGKISGVHGRLA